MKWIDEATRAIALAAALAAGAACGGGQTGSTGPGPERRAPRDEAVETAGPGTAGPGTVEPDEVAAACAPYDEALAAGFEPYLEAFSNAGLELSPDGQTLLFRSSRGGGSPQLFVAPATVPAAEPLPVAPSAESVSDAFFTADGQSVLFLRDRGNDENHQLYRASLEGGEVVDLTAAPERFHESARLSRSGEGVYLFRGVRSSTEYELVEQPVAGGAARHVATFEGFHAIADLHPDGRKALAVNILSLSESRLLEVDLESGESRVVAPTAGAEAHASDGAYSADGKAIYVVTDEGRERAYLKRLDSGAGERARTYEAEGFDVRSVLAAPRGGLLAVTLDGGSHSTVDLVDGRTLKRRARVDLPIGELSTGRRFTADGRLLIVNAASPSTPREVFAVDARGKARPLRAETRPGLEALGRVEASVERIPSFDGLEVPINVYLPVVREEGARLPVVVWVHGGPAASSAATWNPIHAYFLARGFAVVEPNVRGSTGFGKAWERADNGRLRLDALRDLEAVNRWIRERAWADPDRLVVFGGSYGGYMTYMALGHQPELWRAGIGLVGVVNLRTFLATTTGAIRMAFRDEFGTIEEDGEFLDGISPIHVVDRFRAPLFVYQGENDPRVPRAEQDQLVAALRARGHAVEYMVAPDEGHTLAHRANRLAFVGRVNRFLDVVLGRGNVPEGCGPM